MLIVLSTRRGEVQLYHVDGKRMLVTGSTGMKISWPMAQAAVTKIQ
jgi:hypothetical protein